MKEHSNSDKNLKDGKDNEMDVFEMDENFNDNDESQTVIASDLASSFDECK
jgi:hypothetical protein